MTQVNNIPIVIKNTDEIVYSRFKAKAHEKGLLIGEAMTQAMEIWLSNSSHNDIDQIMEDRNEAAFRRLYPDLLRKHEKEWGIITNGDLFGIYNSKRECFDAIKEEELSGRHNLVFPIKQIIPKHMVLQPSRRVTS